MVYRQTSADLKNRALELLDTRWTLDSVSYFHSGGPPLRLRLGLEPFLILLAMSRFLYYPAFRSMCFGFHFLHYTALVLYYFYSRLDLCHLMICTRVRLSPHWRLEISYVRKLGSKIYRSPQNTAAQLSRRR
ncbi:hypothetical protein BDN67DRAFT_702960 [Paxillus ammoniavirescens]|nr:hypothetical protein BDN67DRAFT_702960 [Paxillus ammoniavirescens]